MRTLSLFKVSVLLACCAFSLPLFLARAAKPTPSASPSANTRGPNSNAPVLVELFTSEGCSSCPPADALLRQLSGTTAAGHLVIGLSEHVTYWNNLGWADPFSTDTATQRQQAYGERFHLDGVYTPQAVVNGERQLVGSNRSGLLAAIQAVSGPTPVQLHISSVTRDGKALHVTYAVHGALPPGGTDVMAAVADDQDQAQVARGENAGSTLTHVAVTRWLMRVDTLHGETGDREVVIPLAAARDDRHGQHVVLFAQAPSQGPVLSVDAQPIP